MYENHARECQVEVVRRQTPVAWAITNRPNGRGWFVKAKQILVIRRNDKTMRISVIAGSSLFKNISFGGQ